MDNKTKEFTDCYIVTLIDMLQDVGINHLDGFRKFYFDNSKSDENLKAEVLNFVKSKQEVVLVKNKILDIFDKYHIEIFKNFIKEYFADKSITITSLNEFYYELIHIKMSLKKNIYKKKYRLSELEIFMIQIKMYIGFLVELNVLMSVIG